MKIFFGKTAKKSVILLLCAMLLSSSGLLRFPERAHAAEEAVRLVYKFANLFPGAPVQPGWSLVGDPNASPTVKPASYGALISPTALNQFRDFEFTVPSDGHYLLSFSGYNTYGGALATLSVDGSAVGQYSFYNMGGPGPIKPLKTIPLTAGKHTLRLQVAGKPGTNFYMFPTEFIVTQRPGPAQLDTVSLEIAKPNLIVNQQTDLKVTGKMDDGTEAGLATANLSVVSGNPSVADAVYGKLTAKQPGSSLFTATVTLNGVTKQAAKEVQVFAKQELDRIELSLDNGRSTPLLLMGKANKLIVKGWMNDDAEASLGGAAIAYTNSNPAAASIDDSGTVSPVSAGQTTVSATFTLNGVTKGSSLGITVDNGKSRSTYFTPEKVAAARQNVQKYEWAQLQRDAVVANAEAYVSQDWETLWNLVSSPTLPRSYAVNQKMGSPVTGKEIDKFGNYPYLGNPITEPWKITDPSSGYKFPTNDFGAYYRSGLDEHGIFQPNKADRSLLVNTLYPEKGPTWGVDDGFGWVDDQGNRYTFIAYYNHWMLWYSGYMNRAISTLRDAYVLTGDPKYAKAGTVLLDRIADVYPEMDVAKFNQTWFLNSHGGTNKGKIVGSIWETSLVRIFVEAYDAFFPVMDDPDLIRFLSGKANQYKIADKSTAAAIRRNIEDGIVREVYPGVKNAQIRGNTGTHQSTLSMAAVVYDTLPETKEWLDFNFQPGELLSDPYRVTGGNIMSMLVNDVDRDGQGNESAPQYNRIWVDYNRITADILNGYDKYPAADLFKNVKYAKMFKSLYPFLMVGKYNVPIGDNAATGAPGVSLKLEQAVKAFDLYGDPVFAQLAYFLNNNSTEGINGGIYSPDPERIKKDIEAVIAKSGPLNMDSTYMGGYGFTALRDGEAPLFDYGIRYRFPNMDIVEKSKGVAPIVDSAAIEFGASAPGDSITFSFDVPATDTYEVSVKPLRNVAYGVYDVKIDGQTVAQMDFFGGNYEHEPVSLGPLTQGSHQITFVSTGRYEKATGYKLGLIELALLNEQERTRRDATYGENTLRDLWMYYGRNGGHGHRDTLNIGVHAFGLDVSPDLGYPEVADGVQPHRHEWVRNTISHNTVMVDKTAQNEQIVAIPRAYVDGDRVKLFEAEAPLVYTQTEMYRRTTAMIKVDDANSYHVDFFRVYGGNDHHFSFHGAEGAVTTDGLQLVPQPTGTYAGPNVEYGQRPEQNAGSGYGYTGAGFHFLKNVERAASPAGGFSVDWDIVDSYKVIKPETDIHLRLTMLNDVDEVALADGIPPQNKPGNPASLKYMIAHRSGENLRSLFTSVIEPYVGERFIESISSVSIKTEDGAAVDPNEARAVQVKLTNGRTDTIISTLNPELMYIVGDRIHFKGAFGVYSEVNGSTEHAFVHEGSKISGPKGGMLNGIQSSVTGTVIDFTKELSFKNEVIVNGNLKGIDPTRLIGNLIRIQNDGVRNASYLILGVREIGSHTYALEVGDITFIRSYKDTNDFSKGYVYDIQAGQPFVIPLVAEQDGTKN